MDREGEREQLSVGKGDDSEREARRGDVCPPPHSQPHTDTWKSKPVVRPPLLLADANGAVPTGTDARCRVRSSTRVQEACRLMCGRQRYSARLSETRPAPARNRPPGTMILRCSLRPKEMIGAHGQPNSSVADARRGKAVSVGFLGCVATRTTRGPNVEPRSRLMGREHADAA